MNPRKTFSFIGQLFDGLCMVLKFKKKFKYVFFCEDQ